jgi:hypothetical protein
VDCVFLLKGIIDKVLGERGKLYAAFVDYEKAFDTVVRDALWEKLLTQGVSCKLVKMLKSLYSKVTGYIKVYNDISEFFDIGLGVKQG